MVNVNMSSVDYGYSLLLAHTVLGCGSNSGNSNLKSGILYGSKSLFVDVRVIRPPFSVLSVTNIGSKVLLT